MQEFFDQLQVFSERYFDHIGVVERSTPWSPSNYTTGGPRGAIIHYTADNELARVVKWFMREKYNANASANVVVADCKYPELDVLFEDLPLIKELPVTVVQCQPPNKPTWHATWASHQTYGIEALNVGELRNAEVNGGYVSHWRRDHDPDEPEWSMPWSHPTKIPAVGWYRSWEPYTTGQIIAIITLLRHLRSMYFLEPAWVLGHECVQSVHTGKSRNDKRDPGPLMPMRDIRECVFDDKGAESTADWIKAYEERPDYCDLQRSTLVRGWAAMEAGMLPELPAEDVSMVQFRVKVRELITDGKSPFAPVGNLALALLGYHIPAIRAEMHDVDKSAVRIFQRMAGLQVDGVAGPVTRTALEARLYDRGILIDAAA